MSHRYAAILVSVLLAGGVLAGCGRKLPPSPPQQFMPPVVADLAFRLEENRVTLSWTVPQLQKDQPAPAGFRIFRARQVSAETDCSSCKLEFGQTGDVTSKGKKPGSPLHFSETLPPGYKYVYKVVAYDAKGFDGKESKSIEVVL